MHVVFEECYFRGGGGGGGGAAQNGGHQSVGVEDSGGPPVDCPTPSPDTLLTRGGPPECIASPWLHTGWQMEK